MERGEDQASVTFLRKPQGEDSKPLTLPCNLPCLEFPGGPERVVQKWAEIPEGYYVINHFSIFGGGKAGCGTLDAAVNIFGSEGAKCWVEVKADGMGCSGRIFINLVLFHNSVLISLRVEPVETFHQ